MSIDAIYKLTSPDDARASLTLTMTLGEWRRLRATLDGKGEYPGWRVATMIGDMLDHAQQHFTASGEVVEP